MCAYFSLFCFCLVATSIGEIKGTEQMIKKAMRNIMTNKSVIFTKTDLSQICNKPTIRLEAIRRLVNANLLHYANNLWVEPSRIKKSLQKPRKLLLREGWLK